MPLTYTVFAAAAVVRALRDFPVLNSSVVGDSLAFKPSINLGVAVALADSDESHRARRARGRELRHHRSCAGDAGPGRAGARTAAASRGRAGWHVHAHQPGVFGGITGTPILNQPQVGILGLGAVRKQPVVVDDEVVVRPMMAVALTFDHRAADGMVAFKFLARVRELLEKPPADWQWNG